MQLLHLADLHLGKRLYGFSLKEDQTGILNQVLELARQRKPDALLIAGDVYDRSMPTIEAITLFDDFLTAWDGLEPSIPIIIIAGNHDSAQRLFFGGRIFSRNQIHFAPPAEQGVKPIQLDDEWGPVFFWPIPFLNPAAVRSAFPDAGIGDETDALRTVIGSLPLDSGQRNVALAHQFICGALTCESEEMPVGGLDAVPASLFDPFDYVALGHLHRPQSVGGRPTLRYAGSPLRYSFSEEKGEKSATWVELGPKGDVRVDAVPLTQPRGMQSRTAVWKEWEADPPHIDDWLRVTFTDESEIPDLFVKVRQTCPRLLLVDYDNARTQCRREPIGPFAGRDRSPLEIFSELFESRYQRPMNDFQRSAVEEMIHRVWNAEGEEVTE